MMETLRILHVLHSMNRGGAENAIMNYYRHIDRIKVQFDFLLTDNDKCQFEDEILSLGGRVFRVPPMRMSNPFPYLKGVNKFLSSHPEYRIVHSHTSSKSVFPLWIAKRNGVPVRISHSHSSMAEKGIKGTIRLALMPLLKFVATDWLTCGIQAGEYLYGKRAMNIGKVVLFRNVIEGNHYRFDIEKRKNIRKELSLNEDCLVVGHTARYDAVKNHKFDVLILKELQKLHPNSKLLEVGKGVKEGLSEHAKRIGVYDDIIFTGVVNNVWDYEQAMDAFILPSFNEGLPLSIIEAQVSGLPCFTTEGTVSKECSVTDLVTYTRLDEGAKVWAEKIYASRKVERRDRHEEIAKAGYDAETSAKVLQDFYINRYKEYVIN